MQLGLTVFCTAGAILLFYDTLFGNKTLPGFGEQILSAASPILLGAFLAYMLAPLVNLLEAKLFADRVRQARSQGQFCAPTIRAVSVFLVWALVAAVLYLLMSVLIPEVYKSIMQLAGNLESYYNTVYGWVERLFERFPEAEGWVEQYLRTGYSELESFVKTALSQVQTIMAAAGRGFLSVMNFLKNALVGIIVSVYLMSAKERTAAGARRIVCSIFSQRDCTWIMQAVRKVDSIFSGFVRGKLLDSLIIGLLCFIGASLFQFPYTPLVSVFVGVTNIIPFFGPFIGAIPSAFLILLVSPLKALYFVIFILVLQQLDGNIIGPKILGDQTGLSSLWVIIAILIGGSFFGIPGMFFGVPVFACFYSAGAFFVQTRLQNMGLPVDLEAYDGKLPAAPKEREKNREKSEDEARPDEKKRRRA